MDRSVRYRERRWPSGWLWLVVLMIPAIGLIQHLIDPFDRPVGAAVIGIGFPLFLVAMLAVFPGSNELRHITVDERGLKVGIYRLALDRIGYAERVTPDAARQSMWRIRYRGLRIALAGSSVGMLDHETAVAIFTVAPGKPRVWVVKTRNPDALIAALDQIRPRPLPPRLEDQSR